MSKDGRFFLSIYLRHSLRAAVLTAAFVLSACVTVNPQPSNSVPYPPAIKLDSSTDISPGTATASVDGQNVPLTCSTTTECTSGPLPNVMPGPHTLSYSVAVSCFYCSPNPTVLSGTNQFTVMPVPPASFTASLSPSHLNVQQGGSVAATLSFSTTLAQANLSVSGVSGISVSPTSIPVGTPSLAVTFSAATNATVGTGTLNLTVTPQGSGALPAATATAQLTVTSLPQPPVHQLGAFAAATSIGSASTSNPGGTYKVVIAPAPPYATNAPNAPIVATFEQASNNAAEGQPLGFYSGGGVQFCSNGSANPTYGVVLSPNTSSNGLGTNAQGIYWFQALPNNFALYEVDVYTAANGNVTTATSVSFSPDCTLVLVTDLDPSGNGQQRARVYRLSPTPVVAVGNIDYTSGLNVSVVSGGANGTVQFKFNGNQTQTFPIP